MLKDSKITIIRNNVEICNVLPTFEEKGAFNLKITNSISSFPVVNIFSKEKQSNDSLITFSKNDLFILSIRKNEDDDFQPYFKGVFLNKNFKYNKEPYETELQITATHSFFLLSLMQYKDIKSYYNISFYDFIIDIANLVNIKPSDITLSDEIKNINIYLKSYNSNVYRILKDVCLHYKLSIDFKMDNTVDIEYLNKRIWNIHNKEPVGTITQNDILSMSSDEGII